MTMPVAEGSLTLKAPVEIVQRYLSDPAHLPEYCPNVIGVREIQRSTSGNTHFYWTYKMVDVRFDGSAETKNLYHRLEIHFQGGLRGEAHWSWKATDAETDLHIAIEYDLPMPLARKHSENAILQHNEQSLKAMLDTLKHLLDARKIPEPKG